MDPKKEFSIKRIQPTSFAFSKEKQLGKGTFGQVYLGFDEKNRVPVAVKTISSQKIRNATNEENGLAQKIVGQMSNMQLARSDRLVRLISPHLSQRNTYLVCEYCNGGSLKQYLKKKGTLAETQALCFFKDILEGFKCLHERKIVHRDLKPANMLLHNHRIKIGDLGFSKAIEIHQQVLTSIVGSPLYMSPQILSNSAYTQKTDIWSLGIILYEMLLGEAPWRVNSIQQIKQKVKHKLQFPKNCTISQPTRQLILSMLEYEEKNRMDWQTLFKEYLSPSSSQNGSNSEMQQQSQEKIIQKLRQIHEHFTLSIAIQSQYHVNYMLLKYGKKYADFAQTCGTAREFFQKLKKIKSQQQLIEPITNVYVQNRNKNAFLMILFIECYERSQEINGPIVYTCMLMIIKYCIVNTEQLISNALDHMENADIFLNSYYWQNFKMLLEIDLELLKNMFKMFMSEIFMVKMKQYVQYHLHRHSIEEIQKNLKPFFDQESASLQYTQFWLRNQLKQFFNAFKDMQQQLSINFYLISRMIYEHERSSKTHIFANQGQKSNMAKKLQTWKLQQKWRTKIKEIKKFQIQNVMSFINRTMQMNQLNMLGLNFGNNIF